MITPDGRVEPVDARGRRPAGVVQQNLDRPAQCSLGRVHRLQQALMVGQIGRRDHGPARPHGVQLVGHGLQLDRIARQQGHVRPLGHQGRRHRPPQAAGAAADQGPLAGELKVHADVQCHEKGRSRTWSRAPSIARPCRENSSNALEARSVLSAGTDERFDPLRTFRPG
ncbi:hypothetical protein D3C80_1079270 [compost metagenome]